MALSDEQLDRYARQIILKEIGGGGQRKLLSARVVVVGAGGIGAPVIQYLAAGGVGWLRIIDDDCVSLSNLQRQVIYDSNETGREKAACAASRARALNPDISTEAAAVRVTSHNVTELVAGADVVIDGSDNFATRLIVSDACTARRIPLVSGSVGQFQAQIGTFQGWKPDQPCYRCFVGDAFDADDCDTCAELGVLGAMAGIAGSFAALEVLRQVIGFGDASAGKLHIFDGLNPGMRTIRITKDPNCSGCMRSEVDDLA